MFLRRLSKSKILDRFNSFTSTVASIVREDLSLKSEPFVSTDFKRCLLSVHFMLYGFLDLGHG